ncbi:MAG TPA: DUF4350 domain-containing protein [Cellulomonas sp.]
MSGRTAVPPTTAPAGPVPPGARRAAGSSGPRVPGVISTGPVVVGDGTTAGGRTRRRWRRSRWLLLVAAMLAVGVLAAVLPEPATSEVALAPDNPGDQGARAVAQVLEQQGVHITYVRTTGDAVAAAGSGSTLLVTSDWLLMDAQVEAIEGTSADLVLLAPSTLLGAAPGLGSAGSGSASSTATEVDASCTDPDAQAAGSISAAGTGLTADATAGTDLTLCFPVDGTDASGALYAVSTGDRRVVALADAGMITNARIEDAGNAALVLRVLGRTTELVWYVPSADDLGISGSDSDGSTLSELVPPLARLIGLQLLVVVAVLALWRGRRLGRVVVERLPVVVRSAETTRGRARLYRASKAHGHAAAALRAGAAARCAARLGLPRSAGAAEVIDAVVRASGRPSAEVADLLYGPPPTTDAGLDHLVRRLDQLESEVHRT